MIALTEFQRTLLVCRQASLLNDAFINIHYHFNPIPKEKPFLHGRYLLISFHRSYMTSYVDVEEVLKFS